MRGSDNKQATMLTLITPEHRVPKDHPLRRVKALADAALTEIGGTLDAMYSNVGRPSIPPERLLKSMLLMAFYTVRSERMFCEQLDYNLLFRWFLDMNTVEDSFDHSSFAKNKARLMEHEVAWLFFETIVTRARKDGLMSAEHFTVDGTLIEAWASMKSFKKKDGGDDEQPPDDPGNPTVNFHGEKRSNDTHASSTDGEAKLARKGNGKEAKLAFSQHALMENRNGLLVALPIAPASGTAERDTAVEMLDHALKGTRRITLGADKGYDTSGFIEQCRIRNVTPHVTQSCNRRRSAIDERTVRHPGYAISQRVRKRVEEIFGWMKTVGNFRRTRFKGLARTEFASYFVGAAYNLIRMAKLLPATAA